MSKRITCNPGWLFRFAGAGTVLLAFILLLSGCFGRPTGSVAGYIIVPVDETRGANIRVFVEPIPSPGEGYMYGKGARILVQSGSWSSTAIADEHGYFNVPGVPAGSATVTITYGSYTVTTTVYVEANKVNLIGDRTQGFRIRKWTVMVYMCADNNLGQGSPSADYLDLEEMKRIGSTLNVSVVVQHDRPGRGTGKGAVRYYIKSGEAEVVYDWGRPDGSYEIDMGNPNTLADFVSWAKQNYPAQYYLLVLWNHGDGWQIHPPTRSPNGTFQRAICIDETSNTVLNVDEIPHALDGGNNVDVLAMDACLMNMAEVAYEVKDVAKVIVGSEELTPGEGYPYDGILSDLTRSPSMSPQTLSQVICDRFADEYPGPFNSGGYTYYPTQAAINLGKVSGLADRVRDLVDKVAVADGLGYRGYIQGTLNAARASATEFGKGANPPYCSFDLYQFADYLDENLSGSQTSALRAIGDAARAITSFFDSSGLIYRNYSAESGPGGLAIYIPPVNYERSTYYGAMRFVQHTRWDRVFQYIQ